MVGVGVEGVWPTGTASASCNSSNSYDVEPFLSNGIQSSRVGATTVILFSPKELELSVRMRASPRSIGGGGRLSGVVGAGITVGAGPDSSPFSNASVVIQKR